MDLRIERGCFDFILFFFWVSCLSFAGGGGSGGKALIHASLGADRICLLPGAFRFDDFFAAAALAALSRILHMKSLVSLVVFLQSSQSRFFFSALFFTFLPTNRYLSALAHSAFFIRFILCALFYCSMFSLVALECNLQFSWGIE